LHCSGTCPDNTHCKEQSSENHHGGIRRWCGCSKQEPEHCHTVIYKVGKGEGGNAGEHYILCAGGCGTGNHQCLLIDGKTGKLIPREPEGYWFPEWKHFPHHAGHTLNVRCECELPKK
jgi:hypothetical protein